MSPQKGNPFLGKPSFPFLIEPLSFPIHQSTTLVKSLVMDSESAVVDISSDDEDGDLRGFSGRAYTDEQSSSSSSTDWLSEALNRGGGCDFEVMVGDELNLLSAAAVVSMEQKDVGKPVEVVSILDDDAADDDDECMILDGDPDKPVDIVRDDKAEERDEVLVVAEKGQIACRDYPHPRHLCAIFPFRTTPHESYCEQCHCYVCDSLAPCVKWGNGASSTDHCHSTDKDERWKQQRITVKEGTLVKKPVRVNNLDFLIRNGHKSGGAGQTPARNNFIYQPPTSIGSLPAQHMTNMIAQKPIDVNRCQFFDKQRSVSSFSSSNVNKRCQQQPRIYCREKVLPKSQVSIPVNHGFQDRQPKILPPRVFSGNLNFKRSAVRSIARNVHAFTSVHAVTDNNVPRIPFRRNQHRPVILPHDFHQNRTPSTRTFEEYSQHSQMLSPSGDEHPNLKDMLAGLESHLGLSDDDSIVSDTLPLCNQTSGLTTPSHASNTSLDNSNYQTNAIPSQPTGCGSSFVQSDPSCDWNVVRNSTVAKQNMDAAFFIDTSSPPEIQIPVWPTTSPVVPNCDIASGALSSIDWMSIFEANSLVNSNNPAMSLGVTSPESLPIFDFKDTLPN